MPPPDDESLLGPLEEVARRFEVKFLGETDDPCIDPDDPTPGIYGAAVGGRSTTPSECRGKAASRLGVLQSVPFEARDGIVSLRCVRWRGFPLHAGVRMHGSDRDGIERLCRYTGRGPVATNRLSLMDDGRLRYDLKRPWSDGTTAVAFTPMEFVERLMALIPPP